MGSPEGEGSEDEKPQHKVTVPPLFLSKFQVTQEQWRVIASRQALRVERNLETDPSRFKGDKRPVERVSWYDAVECCQRLSKQTGKEYRLPSEAEWEYACRAGTTTPFHFGETISPKLVRCKANLPGSLLSIDKTSEVGQFSPNSFGLYDMHGNVLEWCEDDYHDRYGDAPIDGSAWLSKDNNTLKVLRGGSWGINPDSCRSAIRLSNARVNRLYDVGFRVVCVAPRTT